MHHHGIVTRAEGPRLWVDVDGREIPCTLRGRLKRRQVRVSSLVVVGDAVQVELGPDGSATISAVEPRSSELSRPGFRDIKNVVAANLDLMVIVSSAHQPPFKRRLVDRFLVTARRGGMEALLVVNKCDLESEAVIRSWTAPLEDGGMRAILTSTVDGRGIEELREAIGGLMSVLAGQSGVGKSSLVNAMFPEVAARTAEVSAWSKKGRHTTTASRLYRLPGGGYLADTPGIRTLGLFEADGDAVANAFPDIAMLAAGCKFRDCSHTHEPGCAVKDAVETGEIDAGTYDSYVRIRRRR